MFSSRTRWRLVLVAIVGLCLFAAAAIKFGPVSDAHGTDVEAFPVLSTLPVVGTRFVATFGSDAGPNDCLAPLSPCATIGHAISVANPGETINIGAGTFTEFGLIVNKDLTFTGVGA